MAHLWCERDLSTGWIAAQLRAAEYELSTEQGAELLEPQADAPIASGIRLVRQTVEGKEQWVLLAERAAAVCVNGARLRLGIRVLRDRDEIIARPAASAEQAGKRFYFSTERLARVEPYPGREAAAAARCARCKKPLANSQAVCCPKCGAWHHQTDHLPCWTYHTVCSVCDQPTDIETTYRWTPEELEQ